VEIFSAQRYAIYNQLNGCGSESREFALFVNDNDVGTVLLISVVQCKGGLSSGLDDDLKICWQMQFYVRYAGFLASVFEINLRPKLM